MVNEVKELALMCGEVRVEAGSSKLAVLVNRDLEYGMTRMWSVFVEDKWDVEIEVFRTESEAITWLMA